MKRFFIYLACVGTIVALAVACKGKDNPNDPQEQEQEEIVVPVNIDKVASSEVASMAVLDIPDNGTVVSDSKGNLEIHVPAEGEAKIYAEIPKEPLKLEGSLKLKSNGEVPEICKYESGAVFSNATIRLSFDNPSPKPIAFNGIIEVGGVSVAMPEVVVPPAQKGYKVDLVKDPQAGTNNLKIPTEIIDKINKLDENGIEIVNITAELADPTRSIAPAAEEKYEFSAGALFMAPLVFPKGTELKMKLVLDNLGIDPKKYVGQSKKYELKVTVTNSLPFQIDGFGETPTGVKATISKPIAPGSIENPVETEVTVTFVCTGSTNTFNDATINITYKALEDATLNKNQKIEVSYDGITYYMSA